MHEYSMTTQIVESVLKEASERSAKRVVEVHLTIGSLTFLNPEQVKFWYNLLTEGTIMEKSRLRIERKEGTVTCRRCGYEGNFNYEDDPLYHVPIPTLLCPRCRNIVEIVTGKECTIKSIKMVVQKDGEPVKV